jgi:hypothetical protein
MTNKHICSSTATAIECVTKLEEWKHLPYGKQIADTNVDQNHNAATAKPLDDSSSYQRGGIRTDSADNASDKKDEVRCQDDRLASEDVRKFSPEWD